MAITEPRPAEQPTPTSASSRDRSRPLFPAVAAGIIVLVAGLMLWSQQRVPSPHPASAPATEFSAERAIVHVDAIGTQTRFLGSSNHERTQRYLLAELRRLGLEPRVQRTAVVNRFSEDLDPSAGTVTNIFARMPGTASTGSIALNAHYDSGPGGPAASDCAACVASVLEAARALRAGPPLRNDVVLVFSDGEENSDLGAAAFAGQSPLMKDIDAVMNWDVSGSHGLPVMLGTNSAWLVGQTLEAAPDARAYSVMPSLFRGALKAQQLNLDTQEYMDRGAAGVQFIYFRGTTDYHTRLDNVDRLGRGSLQMDGDYGLALRASSATTCSSTATSATAPTYFNLTGRNHRGVRAGGRRAAGASGGGPVPRRGRCWATLPHRITVRGLGLGLIAFPVTLLVTTATTVISWALVKQAVPDLRVLTIGTSENEFFVFGLVAMALAVFAALDQPLLRRARAEDLALGALAGGCSSPSRSRSRARAPPICSRCPCWPPWRSRCGGSGLARQRLAVAAGISVPAAVLVVVYAPVMLLFTVLAILLNGMGMPVLGAMGLFASLAAGLFIPYLRLGIPGRRGLAGSRWLGLVARGAPRRGPAGRRRPAAGLLRELSTTGLLELRLRRRQRPRCVRGHRPRLVEPPAAGEGTAGRRRAQPLRHFLRLARPRAGARLGRSPARAAGSHERKGRRRACAAPDVSARGRRGRDRSAHAGADHRRVGPGARPSRSTGPCARAGSSCSTSGCPIPASSWSSASAATALPARPHGTTRRAFPRGSTCRRARPTRCPPTLSFRADPTVVTSTTTVRF